MREEAVKKDGGEAGEGIEEILPLVFSQYLTALRVFAADLALFHTGAILSSLGYLPPATATWEHLGEDKCLFSVSVCARMYVCLCVCAQKLLQTIPYNRPPLHVHNCSTSERFRGRSSQVFPVIFCSAGIPLYFSVFFCNLS